MGARIILCDPHRAVVTGPAQLVGQRMESPDIRAGMAMLLAGLCAEGAVDDRRRAPDRQGLRADRRAPAPARRPHRARRGLARDGDGQASVRVGDRRRRAAARTSTRASRFWIGCLRSWPSTHGSTSSSRSHPESLPTDAVGSADGLGERAVQASPRPRRTRLRLGRAAGPRGARARRRSRSPIARSSRRTSTSPTPGSAASTPTSSPTSSAASPRARASRSTSG